MTSPDNVNVRYRLWFAGQTVYYTSLLPAMEQRKAILATGAHSEYVHIEERDGDGWVYFDAERFLDGLAVLFAPAE